MRIVTPFFSFEQLQRSDVGHIHSLTSDYRNISPYWTTHIRHINYWENKWDASGLWDDTYGMLKIVGLEENQLLGVIWFFKGLSYCEGLEIGWNAFYKIEKGVLGKIVRIFNAYLFSTYNIPRIQCNTSIASMTQNQTFLDTTSFVCEGCMRKAMYVRGELVDLHLFSVLKDDYRPLDEELALLIKD